MRRPHSSGPTNLAIGSSDAALVGGDRVSRRSIAGVGRSTDEPAVRDGELLRGGEDRRLHLDRHGCRRTGGGRADVSPVERDDEGGVVSTARHRRPSRGCGHLHQHRLERSRRRLHEPDRQGSIRVRREREQANARRVHAVHRAEDRRVRVDRGRTLRGDLWPQDRSAAAQRRGHRARHRDERDARVRRHDIGARAHQYRDELAAIDASAALDASGTPIAIVVHSGTF